MSTWRLFVVCGCTVFLLSSCQFSPPKPNEISRQVNKSLVLIYYQGKQGQGTGFFVQEKGNKQGCNVLTARHVVPIQNKIKLRTSDQENWQVSDIQRFPNHDLAVINFKVDDKNECPYTALNLGDSDSVKVFENIYIAGFPGNGSVPQFTSGKVSYIGGNIDGYGISYDVTTAPGMSGGPVINTWGKVIAVHKGKQGIFNGGIPIKAYKENISKVSTKSHPVLQYFPFILITVLFPLTFMVFGYYKPIAIKPDDADAWHNRGISLHKLERYQEAIESYDKAIAIKPDDHYAWNNRGVSLNELERYQEAIESYDKAIAIKPDFYLSWNNRGISLNELERYQEAIESYDKVISIKPDYYLSWHDRGVSLENLKRYKEALESYDKAIAIKPDYYLSWYGRGNSLIKLERYQEAIESYDKAIAIKPDYHEAWYGRGYALHELERYLEAIESYDKAIAIKPDKHEAWNNRGLSLDELKRYLEAIKSYDKAIAIKPDYADAWNNRGWSLENLKRYQEALESYNQAIKINPNNETAINNRKRLLKKINENK